MNELAQVANTLNPTAGKSNLYSLLQQGLEDIKEILEDQHFKTLGHRCMNQICDSKLDQTSNSLTGIMSHLAQLKAGLKKSYNLSILSVSTT